LAEQTPPLRRYLRVAKRQAWLILLVPALSIAAAAFIVHQQKSVYQASMGIAVVDADARPPLGNLALAQTMKSLLKSDVVARRVVNKLDLPMSSPTLAGKLQVQIEPNSSVLHVSYDSTDKAEALSVVTEVGAAFEKLAREKLGISTSLKRPGPLSIVATVIDPPHLSPDRVSPQPARVLGFAGVLGLALGLVLAFARESLDDRIRSRSEAEEVFGAPVIGALPPGFRERPNTDGPAQPTPEAEAALQLLRANLETPVSDTGSTILVTSALDGDRPATIVANLGVVLARAGEDVLCIDADVHRPILDRLLGVPQPTRGLLSVIEDGVSPEDAIQEVKLARPSGAVRSSEDEPGGRLKLLTVGAPVSDGSVAASSHGLLEVVKHLPTGPGFVLIHSPGLLSLSPDGAASIMSAVDNVLVVARHGTSREAAERVRSALEKLGTRKVALVLTDVRHPQSSTLE
jgi:capsular polysaccharide biosynthesis protein/MinD-like ATPase involved in chromosome partitioning or flagellar assembly